MLKWFSRSSAARSANSCPTAVPQAATQAVQSAEAAQVLPATADPMSLAVSVKEDGKGNVLLSVIPPASGPRPKLDVAIVIDKSGSMGCTANENGGEDVKLFSKMDLVKRAAEVIARSLTPDDSLTLIAFASTVMRLTRRERMDAVGLSRALTHIAALQPGGGTALWDGLHAGLHEIEIAYRDDDSDASRHGDGAASGRDGSSASDAEGERLPVVIMLTDGQPSPSPPAGELEELRKYLAARDAAIAAASDNNNANGRPKGFTAPPRAAKLITMGFGYDVNSKLLVDLANAHDGCAGGNEFAFIPDGTMLLTTFVNLMANLQSVCARHAVLRISAPPTTAAAAAGNNPGYNANSADIASLVEVTGEACWKQVGAEVVGSRTSRTGAETETTGPGIAINLGCVAYGQPRQVVLSAKRDTTSDSGTAAMSAAGPVPLLPDWRAWDLDLSYEPLADSFTSVDVTGAAEVEGSGGGGEASMEAAAEGGVVVVPGGGLLVERDELAVTQQLHRSLAVSAIAAAARWASLDLSEAQEAVKKVAAATMKLPIFNAGSAALGSGAVGPHPIVEDLTGQVSEAVSTREVWNRWGQHYVKSLLCAHKTQTCNNFKDPGVQVYGGAYTKALRDALNAMCDSLPVPRPSIPARDGTAWGTPAQPISADTFRGAFNNRYGGCFGPGSHVLMADGSLKAVEDLRKGDMVRTRHAPAAAITTTAAGAFGSESGVDGVDGASVSEEARVECVVTYRGVATVRLPGSGLSITPWHPVRMADGTWRFPADLVLEAAATAATATARRLTTGHDAGSSSGADACGADEGKGIAAVMEGLMERPAAVYNLVLDRGHVVVVEGVEAVTLGHGFTEDVVRHPYYGTQAVLRDLQQQPGWSSGWVDLGLVTAKVDPHTGLVCGYEPSGTSTATCASATKSAAADGPSYIMNSSMPVAAVAICG